MTEVKVKLTGAYVGNDGPGSVVSLPENTARYVAKIGYGEIIEEPKVAEKPKSKPKAKAKSKSKPKGDE